MVAPIRSREDFAALAAARARFRSGPVWIAHVPGRVDDGARVAYAIGTKVGTAVRRNRVRRRLRVVMRSLDEHGRLRPGLYLVGVRPGVVDLDFATLRAHVQRALPVGESVDVTGMEDGS